MSLVITYLSIYIRTTRHVGLVRTILTLSPSNEKREEGRNQREEEKDVSPERERGITRSRKGT
jgi:hypothetical protein